MFHQEAKEIIQPMKKFNIRSITCLTKQNETLWVGSAQGLWRLSPSANKPVKLSSDLVTDLTTNGSSVWCATWMDRGLLKVASSRLTVVGFPNDQNIHPPRLLSRQSAVHANHQSVWVGAEAGLYRYNSKGSWSPRILDEPVDQLFGLKREVLCVSGSELIRVVDNRVLGRVELEITPDSRLLIRDNEVIYGGTNRFGEFAIVVLSTPDWKIKKVIDTRIKTSSPRGVGLGITSLAAYKNDLYFGVGSLEMSAQMNDGTEGAGLFVMNRLQEKTVPVPQLTRRNVHALLTDKTGLWIAGSEELLYSRWK